MIEELSAFQYPNCRRIGSAVRLVTFDVFISVFAPSDCQDED